MSERLRWYECSVCSKKVRLHEADDKHGCISEGCTNVTLALLPCGPPAGFVPDELFKSPQSKATSLSDLLPPPEIVEASRKISEWMKENGYRNWQMGDICDRSYARKSEKD